MAKVKKDIKAIKVKQGPGSLAWMFSFFGAALLIFLLAAGDDHLERERTGQLYQEIKDNIASETTIKDIKQDSRYESFFTDMNWRDRQNLATLESAVNEISKEPQKIKWNKIGKRILSPNFPKTNNLTVLRESVSLLKEKTLLKRVHQKQKTKNSLAGKNISRNYEEILDDISEMFLSGRSINPDTTFDPIKDQISVFQQGGLKGTPVIPGVPENLVGLEMLNRFLRPSFIPRFDEIASYARDRTEKLQNDIIRLKKEIEELEEDKIENENIIAELKSTLSEQLREGALTFIKPHYTERSIWLNETIKNIKRSLAIRV